MSVILTQSLRFKDFRFGQELAMTKRELSVIDLHVLKFNSKSEGIRARERSDSRTRSERRPGPVEKFKDSILLNEMHFLIL
jgi:hypothetical protein